MTRKNTLVLLCCTAVVFTIGVIGYLYDNGILSKLPNLLSNFKSTENVMYDEERARAYNSHSKQEYDTAIAEFKEVLKIAPTPLEAAKAKLELAGNYYSKSKDGGTISDEEEAFRYYFEIIDDASLPPRLRAITLDAVAEIASRKDIEFYKKYFNKSPYNTFLVKETDPFARLKVAVKVLEYSYSLYPTAYAKYAIVNIGATSLSYGFPSQSDLREETATSILKNIEEGDATFATDSNYRDGLKIILLSYRATAFDTATSILKNTPSEDVEAVYQRALAEAERADSNDLYVKRAKIWLGYYYAAFLADTYGESRSADIVKYTNTFKEVAENPKDNVGPHEVFSEMAYVPTGTQIRSRANKVASYSPIFKDFLKTVGWEF